MARSFYRRPLVALLGTVIGLSVTLLGAEVAMAANLVVPLPGEKFLTPAERSAVVAAMTPNERRQLGHQFADDAPDLAVAYTQREFQVLKHEDGTLEAIPLPNATSDGAAITLVATEIAARSSSQIVSGTNLYMSMGVWRTRTKSPHEWKFQAYAEWRGDTGLGNWNNTSLDGIGLAWAGNMALHSHTWSSAYKTDSDCGPGNALRNFRVADASPNAGIAYEFSEWQWGTCEMYWALTYTYVRKNTFSNTLRNAVYKYFHTQTGLTYSFGFSASGPSVSISPTSNQWSAALYVTFDA